MATAIGTVTQDESCPNREEQDQDPILLPVATIVNPQDEQDESDRLLKAEALEVLELADEDAHSLVGVSISRAAARFLSPRTPAAEKAAAMEDLDGGGFFQADEDNATIPDQIYAEKRIPVVAEEFPAKPENLEESSSLANLPPPQLQSQGLPTPWVAGAKPPVIERLEETRSALRAAVGSSKRRTLSGGADALKKILPSIPKPGSFLPTLPSTSLFSSVSYQKGRDRALSLYKEYAPPSLSSSPDRYHGLDGSVKKDDEVANDATLMSSKSCVPESDLQLPSLRRVTSDGSLLYHTLSRTSSLGDDARFENQRDMVNSRMKAIRDSLQDRSSFRLPAMPSMPRVPGFSFPLSFVSNSNSAVPQFTWKANADDPEGNLPGNAKKRMNVISEPAMQSGMMGASISRPDAVIDSVRSVMEKSNDSHLERAISNLNGDIVIMGGYRGSILRSAKPPHRQLWVPVKVGLNIRKVNLEVGLDPEDEEHMEESIFASGMLQHIGPVDISRRLFKRLRECENARNGKLRIWDYGYDWRLSPHLLSKKLLDFIRNLPSNQPDVTKNDKGVLVIAHSLGGLITRHAVNQCPELFSGVIYAGVPQACINILGPLRNGDSVLLSSRVLTAQVNFTLRTSFALLPLDGQCFVDKNTKEQYPIDFFDVDDWVKYRLSPCTDPPLPPKINPVGVFANILKQGSLPNLQLSNRNNPISSNRNSQSLNDSAPDIPATNGHSPPRSPTVVTRGVEAIQEVGGTDRTLAPQMGSSPNQGKTSISTTVTIPRDRAVSYLRRTLAEVKKFKLELAHMSEHRDANRYPPLAIIYGKSVPTVYAARVDGRDGIARTDCYDELAFASGDGVCLSREAMLPDGYQLVKGGRISSDRGHLTLLGDLNAVGRAIQAVTAGRAKRVGLGG